MFVTHDMMSGDNAPMLISVGEYKQLKKDQETLQEIREQYEELLDAAYLDTEAFELQYNGD